MTKKKASPKAEPITQLLYIGPPGSHLSGIPARDLGQADLARLSDGQIKDCLRSGLYALPEKEK
jgi:hypothetical protein